MAELRLQRTRKAKDTNLDNDFVVRISGKAYRTLAWVRDTTGMSLREAVSTLVEFAADNLVIEDNFDDNARAVKTEGGR